MTDKVLLVDDDTNILAAYSRRLRKHFELWTVPDGKRGLAILESDGPFAVVVSDMRMPGMDGIEFLGEVMSRAPNTVRMMLTGNADQKTAIDAVNEGNIFRFYTKPCPPEVLEKAIMAGLEQYRLIAAEKTLLEQTLAGSVKMLIDVLSVNAPEAFSMTRRLRNWARKLAVQLDMRNAWELELAAMLSPIGQITLPSEVAAKIRTGAALTPAEWEMANRAPEIGSELIANIPRLKGVSDIVRFQYKGFDGSGFPNDWVTGEEIPLGARILKVLIDLAAADGADTPTQSTFGKLEKKSHLYDPEILSAARSCVGVQSDQSGNTQAEPVIQLPIDRLRPGDRLVSELRTESGNLALSAGYELTPAQVEMVQNLHKVSPLKQPVLVIRGATEGQHADPERAASAGA